MPIVRNGRIIAGVGGLQGNCSIDGIVPPALQSIWAGSACDLDGDAIVANGSTDNVTWDVLRYRPSTGMLDSARADEGYPTERGAFTLGAGGGVWAARWQGYFDSHGREEPDWGVCAVTEQGRIIVHTDPYRDGAIGSLIAIDSNNQETVLVSQVVNPNVLVAKGDVIVWEIDGKLSSLGTLTPVTARRFFLRSFSRWVDGTVWIVGYTQVVGREWLVAQPATDPTRAILISNDQRDYRPDAEFQPDGHLWIVTAENKAETPDSLRRYEFNFAQNRRRLVRVGGATGDWAPIVWTDLTAQEPPIDPPPPPIDDPLAFYYIDRIDAARSVNAKYPQLLQKAREQGEQFRGAFVDQFAHELNRRDNKAPTPDGYIRSPWGRKRKNDGTLNTDALTFRLSVDDLDKKKLIDVVAGDNFQPDWNLRPPEEEPGNGTWAPPQNPDLELEEPEPPPPPIDPPPWLYPHETFLKYAQAAGVILAPRVVPNWNDLSQAARDEIFPHVRQRAIGQGDRYRKRELNPTVMDLVIGGLLDLPTEQFDPLMDESIAAQKLLQPQSSALVRLRVEGTRFMRGTQPFLWAGCSAFDLPVRIAEGDFGFLDWMAETGFTIARIVVASVYRSPRTLAQGLEQLPGCLKALQDRGLYAEVVALCDTGTAPPNYNLSRQQMVQQGKEVSAICEDFENSIAELFNERDHPTHADIVRDNMFAEDLSSWFAVAGVPVSLGSSGGGALPLSFRGDYLTVHTDRSDTPFENHLLLRAFQDERGKPVISDEPQPVSEVPASRPDRTTDPAYGTALGASARQAGLAGVTFHCDAGLSARLSDLGPVQREAARRFIAALKGQ